MLMHPFPASERASAQAMMMMQSACHGAMGITRKVSLHFIDNAKLAPRLLEQFQMLVLRRCSCSARMLSWMSGCCCQSWSLATAECLCTSQAAGEHRPLSHAVIFKLVVNPPLKGPVDTVGNS